MKNKYGIAGFTKMHSKFGFDWTGAPVSFLLFGKRHKGTVYGYDALNKTLTVELWDGRKRINVTAAYQAFRKEK